MNLKKSKKILFICFFCFCLCGCAKEKPAYEQSTQNAIDTITAIEQGLPAECKTDANKLLFNVSRKETASIKKDCDKAVAEVTRDKLKWKLSFWALVGVVAAYILRKVMK